jgi:hypothetical protein
MWGLLVRKVYAENRQYQTIQELKKALLREWRSVTLKTCQNLVKSMPDRVFELIEKKGGLTHY